MILDGLKGSRNVVCMEFGSLGLFVGVLLAVRTVQKVEIRLIQTKQALIIGPFCG